jgi:hypothetical protein
MGRFARIEFVYKWTDHFHPAEFWCEVFDGEHLSVDFKNGKSKLVVRGEKDSEDSLYKWRKWEKINQKIEFPSVLSKLKGNYEWINCEFIDGKLIEVHFRQNPDFRYNNTVAIPVWNDEQKENIKDYTFIKDNEYYRNGFYIK